MNCLANVGGRSPPLARSPTVMSARRAGCCASAWVSAWTGFIVVTPSRRLPSGQELAAPGPAAGVRRDLAQPPVEARRVRPFRRRGIGGRRQARRRHLRRRLAPLLDRLEPPP